MIKGFVQADKNLPVFENREKLYITRYVRLPDELQLWNWDQINERQAASYTFEWLDTTETPTDQENAKLRAALESVRNLLIINDLSEGSVKRKKVFDIIKSALK